MERQFVQHFLTVFTKILQFWAILPYRNSDKLILVGKNLLLMSTLLLLCVYSFYLTIVHVYPKLNAIHIPVDILKFVTITLSPLTYFLMVIWRNKKWIKILDMLEKVKTENLINRNRLIFLISFMVYHHWLLISYLCTMLTHEEINSTTRIVQKFPLAVSLVTIHYEGFCAITVYLCNLTIMGQLRNIKVSLEKLQPNNLSSVSSLKCTKRLYLNAVEMTSVMNEYFGPKLLINFANSSIRLLWVLTSSIQIWNPDQITNMLDSNWDHFYKAAAIAILGLVRMIAYSKITRKIHILFQIPAFIITMSCNKILKKVEDLISKCYELQYKYPQGSYEQRELQAFWIYATRNRLSLTALAFFEIQPSVLLGLVGSITTYFIALIQFKA